MEDFTGKSRVHQGVCRSHSSIQIELDLFKCTGLCVGSHADLQTRRALAGWDLSAPPPGTFTVLE